MRDLLLECQHNEAWSHRTLALDDVAWRKTVAKTVDDLACPCEAKDFDSHGSLQLYSELQHWQN